MIKTNIKIFFTILMICLVFEGLSAQYKHESVFPDLEGDELLEKLINNYKPILVLDYSQCRDTMYQNIYRLNDTVHCVYTNYGVYLPDGVDPSTYIYNNGTSAGINAEHTYPTSKGTEEGNAKSDMHHIFPSKINVNSDRGSFPFNEIQDNKTENWYFKDIETHNVPYLNIDSYSEYYPGYFEPREDHKGNVARAMFYIKTMYKVQTDNADPDFFNLQKDTLCKWHFKDPVDSLEWIRTWQIASYQDNKPNPYVLDCSLASRTFCDFISDQCMIANTKNIYNEKNTFTKIYPNPANYEINLSFLNPDINHMKLTVYDIMGEVEYFEKLQLEPSTIQNIKLKINNLNPGVYFLNISGFQNNEVLNINKVFIKQ